MLSELVAIGKVLESATDLTNGMRVALRDAVMQYPTTSDGISPDLIAIPLGCDSGGCTRA